MSLFSNKAVDAGSAALFAKPVRRDDLVTQAREAHKASQARPEPLAAPASSVEQERADSDEDEERQEVEDRYMRAQRAKFAAGSPADATNGSTQIAETAGGPESEGEDAAGSDSDDGEETSSRRTPALPSADAERAAEEAMERTLFVKNVPYAAITDKKVYRAFRRLFEPGVKSVRFRSIAMSEMMPRKAAFIKQKLHPSRDAVNSYVVFDAADRVYEAIRELNGREFAEHHLFVDHAAHPRKQDAKRSVFVGNLPFEAAEEALYAHFADCGAIENVRIVRDPQFNLGKGFAYVQFDDVSTVQVALLKNGQPLAGRELRVTRCQTKATKKPSRPAQKPLYQRKAEPKKRRRERVDAAGMALEGERAAPGRVDKKRRHSKPSGKPSGKPAGKPKKVRHT